MLVGTDVGMAVGTCAVDMDCWQLPRDAAVVEDVDVSKSGNDA